VRGCPPSVCTTCAGAPGPSRAFRNSPFRTTFPAVLLFYILAEPEQQGSHLVERQGPKAVNLEEFEEGPSEP